MTNKNLLKYQIFFLIFLFVVSSSMAKTVIVSYDYSGSMRMHGLNQMDFRTWNRLLTQILFDTNLDLSGNVSVIYKEEGLTFPILERNDLITLLRIGSTVIPVVQNAVLSRDKFISLLPQRFELLSDQETSVAEAELYFLRHALNDSTTLWINLSDEDEDVGRQTPIRKDVAKELIKLRDLIHVKTLLNIQVHDRVKISVRKRKSENKKLLDFRTSRSKLVLQEKAGRNRSEKYYCLAKNDWIKILPKNNSSEKFRDISVSIFLSDKKENRLQKKYFFYTNLPFTIDSLVFSSKKIAEKNKKNEVDHLYIITRYYFDNRLIQQDAEIPIKISAGSIGWIVWLFFILIITGILFIIIRWIMNKSAVKNDFTIICKAKRFHKTIELKPGGTVYFGQPGIGKSNKLVCDLKAPDYALKRTSDNSFSLLYRGEERATVIQDTSFDIEDISNNKLTVVIKAGKISPIVESSKPKSTLQSLSSKNQKRNKLS